MLVFVAEQWLVGCWLGPHGTVQGKQCGVDWFESKERKSKFKLLTNKKIFLDSVLFCTVFSGEDLGTSGKAGI